MLNTFFFGYLSLKWRRLVRSIAIILWLIPTNFFDVRMLEMIFWSIMEFKFYDALAYFFALILSSLPIGIISWIIKPFVVKES